MTSNLIVTSADVLRAKVPAGGKAQALAQLLAAGFAVPAWFAVLPEAAGTAGLAEILDATVRLHFPADTLLAVRSSAAGEDGVDHSFAGQLDSFLNVPRGEVAARVADVWRSGTGERLQAYRRERGLEESSAAPAVIVQRMVPAVTAGVAFGIDPVTGRREVAIVSAVAGLGDQLVSGETDAATWEVDRAGTVQERAGPSVSSVLTSAQVAAVAELARATGRHFGRPQDIEWAFDPAGKLWLLQSRPVTGLEALPEADGAFAIWDNSNIAESYGGVTTPLTFSFARRVYEAVYRQFCRLMSVPGTKIEANDDIFPRMLGFVRGRVYYNLLNWYRVLALLPGYELNRPFMEGMMGVKEGLPPRAAAQLERAASPVTGRSRLLDALALGRSVCGLVWQAWRLPRSTAAFHCRLAEALGEPTPGLETWRSDELAAYYLSLERRLLAHWDAPLINDFFAMIAFGTLRRLAQRWYRDDDGTLANTLLARTGGMISAEPVRLMQEMAQLAALTPDLGEKLRAAPVAEIQAALSRHPEFAARCDAYFARFGDRCLEELKLETPTLRDDPLLLYRAVGRLAAMPPRPPDLRPALEPESPLTGARWKQAVFRWVLRLARDRVRGRENLRFERTRVFGRVRRIFVELGLRFHAAGRLTDPRDVFYLTVDEILGFIDGSAVSTNLRALVAARRGEFEAYRREPPPADRFETFGPVNLGNRFDAPNPAAETAPDDAADERRGLGCCAGVARGIARVILDPQTAETQPGDILVARRTDPGWVLLFPAAAGLLVEHGSLLSHSAIVARELNLPAVVSIPGLTAWLRTGDLIQLDGGTGHVRRLARAPDIAAPL